MNTLWVGTIALSLSPGTFGAQVSSGTFIANNQAATMYRITTDFWGGAGAVFGALSPGGGGGGSIARASLHANASLIGANGAMFTSARAIAIAFVSHPLALSR